MLAQRLVLASFAHSAPLRLKISTTTCPEFRERHGESTHSNSILYIVHFNLYKNI